MYYLNKAIGFFASPLVLAIVGGVLAVACGRLGRRRIAKWIGGLTVAWLWLWMSSLVTYLIGVPLERVFLVDGKVPAVETFPKSDAIVLLGGSMGVETNLSPYAEMSASVDRVWQASRLYRADKAKKVIATGDGAKESTMSLLLDLGVAKDDISFLDAQNTEQEARAFAKKGYKKILLVTSAWHMKRAKLMFTKYAPKIEVVCAPADFEQCFLWENTFLLKAILPDINALQLNSVALHEWVGIIGYKLFR